VRKWARFVAVLVLTAVVVAPIAVIVVAAFRPLSGGDPQGLTLESFVLLLLRTRSPCGFATAWWSRWSRFSSR
jgi:ABC-type spermidine/putrescine transport system permease subunit II